MRRRRLTVVGLVVACAAVAGILVVGLMHQDDASETGPDVSTPSLLQPPFEPFAAPAVAGDVIAGAGAGGRLSLADLRGRPVVVNFWASWCDPCRREAPELVAFAKAHPDVDLLGVNSEDSRGDAVPFAAKLGFAWSSIEDRDGSVARSFKLAGLPGTFVVDATGRVVFRKLGTITAAELAGAVGNLG